MAENMSLAEDMKTAIERMEIYQAAQVKRQLSDFADYIYPADEYIELQQAIDAIDRWIEKKEQDLAEVRRDKT
jgi:hypothetical protein